MPGWWCGSCDTTFVDHYTLTPCTAETVVTPLILLVSAAVLYAQQKRVKLLRSHRSYLSLNHYGLREAFVAASLLAIAVSHSVWLVHYLVQHKAAFHYLYESGFAAVWCAALVSSMGFCATSRHMQCAVVLLDFYRHKLLSLCTGCALARQETHSVSAPQVPAVASNVRVFMGCVHFYPHLYRALGRHTARAPHCALGYSLLPSMPNFFDCNNRDLQVSMAGYITFCWGSWCMLACTTCAAPAHGL